MEISIVIPVYNGQKFITECLDTLRKQTFKDYEIICVNDASTDETSSILNTYRKKDSRVVVISNEINIGAANSRNRGLSIAKGKYIIFLDSDDYFYEKMLERTYNEAQKNDADMVVFGYEGIDFSDGIERQKCFSKLYEYNCVDSASEIKGKIAECGTTAWNKLIRREMLIENNIFFQDIPNINDLSFSYISIIVAKRIVFVDDILLCYRYRRNESISKKMQLGEKAYVVEAYKQVFKYIVEHNKDEWASIVLEILLDVVCSFFNSGFIGMNEILLLRDNEYVRNIYLKACSKKEISMHNVIFGRKLFSNELLERKDVNIYKVCAAAEIIENVRRNKKKVALWGVGERGKQLINDLAKDSITIDYLIDENISVQGKCYLGYIINGYKKIAGEFDAILLTNSKYKTEIEQKINHEEVFVI